MKNYYRINAMPPKGIERKRAHIVGGGIAGLATAVFLVDEAHMPGEKITIYESKALNGGCLEAAWDPKSARYRNPGSRMFERRYECTVLPDGKNSVDTNSGPYAPRRDVPGERGASHPLRLTPDGTRRAKSVRRRAP